jgi:hypothetical protein
MLGHFFPLRKAARMGRVRQLAIGLAAVALCVQVAAAADTPPPAGALPAGTTSWGGLTWGIGIATNFDVGGTRVNGTTGATIVNNIVRLTDTSNNVGISFVLESHYFFPGTSSGLYFRPPGGCTKSDNTANPNCTEWAWGPFIAIEVGDGTTAPTSSTTGSIAAFALGMMVGLHHPTVDSTGHVVPNDKSSWNFGIGLRVDPAAQVLGAGFVANQPPPPNETVVRYQKEPRAGVMLLSSFSF